MVSFHENQMLISSKKKKEKDKNKNKKAFSIPFLANISEMEYHMYKKSEIFNVFPPPHHNCEDPRINLMTKIHYL